MGENVERLVGGARKLRRPLGDEPLKLALADTEPLLEVCSKLALAPHLEQPGRPIRGQSCRPSLKCARVHQFQHAPLHGLF